ncbi:hypothetical protein V6Z11_D05G069600 [Gossypium hirsutum]
MEEKPSQHHDFGQYELASSALTLGNQCRPSYGKEGKQVAPNLESKNFHLLGQAPHRPNAPKFAPVAPDDQIMPETRKAHP